MKTTPSPKSIPAAVAAILSLALLSVSSSVSAQGPGTRGPGPHMGPPGGQGGPSAQMGAQQMHHRAERMMRLYDLNGDGKITIAEINDDQARIFAAMDVDNDKSMSVDEIRRRGRSLQIFRTTTLFDLLDANGDGKLSVAEVQAPSQRWFKRYDTNGDGVMEASEIPERSRHRGRRGGHGRR